MKRLLAGLGLAGIGVATWSLIEAHAYRVSQWQTPAPHADFAGLKILNISDIHLLAADRKKIQFLRDVADLEPDLVVLTGDQLSEPEALPALLEALDPLVGIPGAFVYGSHDYYAPEWKNPLAYLIKALEPDEMNPDELPHREMAQALVDRGWIDLRNRTSPIDVNGKRIGLVGVDDPHINLDAYPGRAEGDLRIGLTHAPYTRVLNQMADDGTDLVFAGHTHGGQVCLPGYGAVITNCDLDTSHVAGLFSWPAPLSAMKVCVSKGLGTSPFAPFRLACFPEVQLITLT